LAGTRDFVGYNRAALNPRFHVNIAERTRLGRYEIRAKIGAGGMGEVYRAYDPKISRDVAIKVLTAELAANADRVARFEQEAQAAGALNHPNILAIYDVDTQQGVLYVVSELLEGEELRDCLNNGTIPLRKTIDYAQQVVSGLTAAHEKGIIHRDLKPENLFITKDERVKILDFGIAKLTTQAQSTNPDISEDATRKVLTNPGVIMGTVGYMSPEQVRGEKSDHRSDIFSFGAILHEMLTGRRAFKRETMAETMTAILKEEPAELSASNPNINPALERIVNRCLEKKPERRFQSTADLGFALDALSVPTNSSGRDLTIAAGAAVIEAKKSTWRARVPWIVAAVALAIAVLAVGAVSISRRSANEAQPVRLSFNPPPELLFNDTQHDAAVISPDGQKIAFTATSADGKSMLYVRNLDSSEVKLLPGSENALEPFWSPDSRSVGYGSNGKLKRSELTGANAQVLCDAPRLLGGTWNKEGTIVFGPGYRMTLMQVPARGREPKPVEMKTDVDDLEHRYPYFLPDGRHFLFHRKGGIWAGSLDSLELKQIGDVRGVGVYAPPGWLIFIQNATLVAQPFDAGKLTLSGEPLPILTGAKINGNSRRFSVSDNGVLVWQGLWQREYQLVWYDRSGKQTGAIDTPMEVSVGQSPMLSPDGKRVAVRRAKASSEADANPGAASNLWIIDLDKGTGQRITSTFSQMPVWSPDGNRILYNNGNNIVVKAANGSGEAETLLQRTAFPAAWSSDGRFIIFTERAGKTRMDMWALPMFGDRKEYLLSNSAFEEFNPQLSPNGRWLAYTSDETGTFEIYVQSFSTDGKLGADKKIISTGGGKLPVWRRDGSELFFLAVDGQMMASSVKTTGPEFEFTPPKPLFKTRTLSVEGSIYHEYDVSPDGQRFLIGTLIGDTKAAPPTVIMNWTALLKK
jgi:serine/threonine protein kinase/Tol biopolymer transport system component